MALLRPDELKVLDKLAGQELVQRWKGMEKKLAQRDTVVIANTGLVNSGKSSLFNALLDSFETERFPVGAIRTTKQGDRERLTENVDIVDTPGIDAADEDDETAFAALMEADLIVVTHNIKTGMLNRSEQEWVARLANVLSPDDIRRRVIFACTWIDARERQEGYQAVVAETRRQVVETLGTEIHFWNLSAKRYVTACQKSNEKLALASGIPAFRDFLLQQAEEVRKDTAARHRRELSALCEATEKLLKQQRKQVNVRRRKKAGQMEKQYQPALDAWEAILSSFVSQRDAVRAKLDKLSEVAGESPYVAAISGDVIAFRGSIEKM